MPERHIGEAIDHIDEGVDEIRRLVDRVEVIAKGNRRFKILTALVAIGIVASISWGGYTLHRFNDERLVACRASNDRFDRLFDFIDLQVDSPEGQQLVVGMRATAVIDCDNDGSFDDDRTHN